MMNTGLSTEAQPKQLSRFGVTIPDRQYFERRGKDLATVSEELQALSSERRFPHLFSAATLDNGFIFTPTSERFSQLLALYQSLVRSHEPVFCVPTAGAASRQFQLLRTVLNHPAIKNAGTTTEALEQTDAAIENLKRAQSLSPEQKASLKSLTEVQKNLPRFWNEGIRAQRFAFWDDLEMAMGAHGLSLTEAVKREDLRTIAHHIVADSGLGYGQLPKALMRYHSYPTSDGSRECRLALEEHIRTVAPLFESFDRMRLHFLIAEEHGTVFERTVADVLRNPSLRSHLTARGFPLERVAITWDFQAASTDSVSLDMATRQIVRGPDGTPLLRRAGHGALLLNLTRIDSDGFWLQNVDNVLYDNPQIKRLVLLYKQFMAALGTELQTEAHKFTRQLLDRIQSGAADPALNMQALQFLKSRLQTELLEDCRGSQLALSEKLVKVLDRPIVIAAYVPLEPGLAGGGPFVIETNLDGVRVKKVNTLEGSEFEGGQNNPTFNSGHFFNPVNYYVARRRFDGTRFDLGSCVDPSRFFISEKSDSRGNLIYAYERPGLWNGSLSKALQVNVASPVNTFAAIKDCSGKESFLSPLHHPYTGSPFTALDRQREVVDAGLENYLLSLL